jgi:hypothetical protein
MRAHFEMCYMVTTLPKRMLRATRKSVRIERIIQEFSYMKNPIKRRKCLVRISTYVM